MSDWICLRVDIGQQTPLGRSYPSSSATTITLIPPGPGQLAAQLTRFEPAGAASLACLAFAGISVRHVRFRKAFPASAGIGLTQRNSSTRLPRTVAPKAGRELRSRARSCHSYRAPTANADKGITQAVITARPGR